MDSGSYVTIANIQKHFGAEFEILPGVASKSGVRYTTADGGEISNRGEARVTHRLDNGDDLDLVFQDGDVQFPIISVKDFARIGSTVKFNKGGGTIHLPNGQTMCFQEEYGVYFIHLTIVPPETLPPPPTPDAPRGRRPVFIRPAP